MSGQRATDHAARAAGAPMSSPRVRAFAVVASLLSLFACGAVAHASADQGDGAKERGVSKSAAAAPTSTLAGGDAVPPDDLGEDADLDALAESCFDGDLVACDLLYLHAPVDSDYEGYGDTCGGRQEAGTGSYCGFDTSAGPPAPPGGEPVPPEALGSDPALDALAESCYAGDMEACDELYGSAESGSAYQIYGDTCGGRQPENTGRYCTALEDPIPGTGAVPTTAGPTPTTVADETTTVAATTVPTETTTVVATTVPTETNQPTETSQQTETSQPTDASQPTEPGDIPAPTIEPTGLGDDPVLDALAESCFDGGLAACDELYQSADPGSPYRSYGDTCAGRQAEGSGTWCVDAFGTGVSSSVTLAVPPTSGPLVTSTTTTSDVPPPPVTSAPPSTVPTVPSVPSVPSIPSTSTPGVVPPPTLEPTGLGADPALDVLAESCYAGELAACDDLWRDSDPESAYRNFGDTCAGRQPANTGTWCVDAFSASGSTTSTDPGDFVPTSTTPEPTTSPTPTIPSLIPDATQQPAGLGDDPGLDLLAQSCYDGDMQACDDLFERATIGSEYRTYGDTCAGRQEPGTFDYCRVVFPSTPRR